MMIPHFKLDSTHSFKPKIIYLSCLVMVLLLVFGFFMLKKYQLLRKQNALLKTEVVSLERQKGRLIPLASNQKAQGVQLVGVLLSHLKRWALLQTQNGEIILVKEGSLLKATQETIKKIKPFSLVAESVHSSTKGAKRTLLFSRM